MNIFVTGGTGYIGSTLISRLAGEKEISKIVALARSPEKARQLAARVQFREKLEFADGDIRHHNFDFGNIDVVIHLAAVYDPRWYDENSAEAIEMSVGGTQRLVEAVRRFKVPYFILVSTYLVYGEQTTMLVREDLTPTPRPDIVKSLVKYACEVIARGLADSSTKFVILRLAHVYGVGVLPRWDDVMIKFARLSCSGEDLTIYGDGNQKADYVHVRDVCDCIYRLLISSEGAWNETYNVGGGRAISINELVEVYLKATVEMGLKAPGKSYVEGGKSYYETRGFRPPLLDISKAREKLGWIPSTSIEDGVKELIQACCTSYPGSSVD